MACEAGRRFLAGLGFFGRSTGARPHSHKRVADAEEMGRRTMDQENLQWYFKGYKDGVNVFLVEFWDRIQREDGWKAPPSQSVSRDKNAYLSRSRIVG